MRRARAWLCGLVCWLVLLPEAAALFGQTQSQDKSFAVISITASENGMPVFINGRQAGITPLENFLVPPGEHEIMVRYAQPESWLDTDWVEKYLLAAGDTLVVHAQFKRGYLINSKPYGAEVFVDNAYRGTTPVVVYVTGENSARVELRLTGYQNFLTSIDPTAQRLWNVTLQEDETQTSQQQNEALTKKSRGAHFRKLALLAAGVSAASGVTAILLKRRADDFYGDYLIAGDFRDLDAFYDKATEYDEYSGIAFGVFQASFGLSFYWFLRSTAE